MQRTHAVATRTRLTMTSARQAPYLVRTGQTGIVHVANMCVCCLLDFCVVAMPRLSASSFACFDRARVLSPRQAERCGLSVHIEAIESPVEDGGHRS